MVDDNLSSCPNCGCPIEQSSVNTADTSSYSGAEYDSDAFWTEVKRWWSPEYINLPQSKAPIVDKTVRVDDDSEVNFELEKSLIYILCAFIFKFLLKSLLYLLPLTIVHYAVGLGIMAIDVAPVSAILLLLWAIIVWAVGIAIAFKVFITVLRQYWAHIFLRVKEMHIRYWRSMFRAVRDMN